MTISLWLCKKKLVGEVDRDCSKLYLSATRVGVLLIAPPISDLCVGQPCHSVFRTANSEAFRHTRPYVGVAG
jgi:hypothetical protein